MSALLPTESLVLIGSWNSEPALTRAALRFGEGAALLDAIVEGVGLVEDDPDEMTVGFGGLPNEDGEVELDASVFDGPRHKAGGVAGVRGVRSVARLALEVLRRTDHALLVGEGARKFARQTGFVEENLLTPRARRAWLDWKASLSTRDAWLGPDDRRAEFGLAAGAGHGGSASNAAHASIPPAPGPSPGPDARSAATPIPAIPPTTPATPATTSGTIHVSGLDDRGDLYSCTSTSGLSYKLPGRVGDSPIPGAGLFTDNGVGSAGATGRGEASLQNAAAYEVVRGMERGLGATEACLEALGRIARRTREPRLLRAPGVPAFNLTLYAVRKDGDAGAASIHPGYQYVLWRRNAATVRACASLLDS